MARKNSKHFSTEEWLDFAMEQSSQEQRSAMSRHLETGCKNCSQLANLWDRVGQVAHRDSASEPPASAVQHVRRAFAIISESNRAKRTSLIPRLVFDTLWQPAMVGVRSTVGTPRQVLYRAGEISIEMRIEPEPRSERVNITGQVSNSAMKGELLPAIPVVITSGKGKVASASTNGFGEFHLAFVPETGARISFGVATEMELSIPLDGSGVQLFYRN
jgi:hypothetical protein